MNTYLTSRPATVAAIILAVLSFSGAALAITDTVFRYSSLKTGYYTIGSASMSPQDNFAGSNYSNSASTGLTANVTERCFLSGANLPSGVTVTAVRVWYLSNVGGDPTVQLIAHTLGTGQATVVAGNTIADNSATRKAANLLLLPGLKINNSASAYGLKVCVWPGDFFYAARIAYTYDNAGD